MFRSEYADVSPVELPIHDAVLARGGKKVRSRNGAWSCRRCVPEILIARALGSRTTGRVSRQKRVKPSLPFS